MKYIVIDVGSSYIKSAIVDLSEYFISKKLHYDAPVAYRGEDSLTFEVDAERIYEIVKEIIDYYISTFKSSIKGIMFSTQMHGFLFAENNGKPATPYISWQDNRCLKVRSNQKESYLEYLCSMISRDDMDAAGIYLKPGLALCNAYTLIQEKQFPVKQGMLFCTLGSYLILRLTGEFVCHLTNAAPTGFADIIHTGWNEILIQKTGFDQYTFPMIKAENEICGYYSSSIGKIAVYPDLGDQQAAVLGSMVEPITDINVNVATAAQMSCVYPEFKRGKYEIRPYLSGNYLNTITRIPGGRSFDVLIHFIEDIAGSIFECRLPREKMWERIYGLVLKNTGSDLQVEMGFFKDMLGAEEGAIKNISDTNLTVANLFSGAYDNIAQIYNQYIDWLTPDRKEIERLVFTGGAAWKDQLLTAKIAARTGIKKVLSPLPEEVLIGHLRLAMINEKICDNLEQTKQLLMTDLERNEIKVQIE